MTGFSLSPSITLKFILSTRKSRKKYIFFLKKFVFFPIFSYFSFFFLIKFVFFSVFFLVLQQWKKPWGQAFEHKNRDADNRYHEKPDWYTSFLIIFAFCKGFFKRSLYRFWKRGSFRIGWWGFSGYLAHISGVIKIGITID